MRSLRTSVITVLVAAGCGTTPAATPDLATVSLDFTTPQAGLDFSDQPDLATAPDLAAGLDPATAPDLATPDLVMPDFLTLDLLQPDLAPSCADKVKNGNETDVDCGGGTCVPCDLKKACVKGTDCASTVCLNAICVVTCPDGIKDGNETDLDCGGANCPSCGGGKACALDADCQSGVCTNKLCAMPSCMDGVKNGSEVDIDCGGAPCPGCGQGKICVLNAGCLSGVCMNGACTGSSCMDGSKNGAETDVDCGGGTCGKCADGKKCVGASDCTSGTCSNGVCSAAACNDQVKNGMETDIDCGGGGCPKCGPNKACTVSTDCQSLLCTNNSCIGACGNGVKDGLETDVDCGGAACAACIYGKACAAGSDCASAVCLNKLCVAHTCQEALQENAKAKNGAYSIAPDGAAAFAVYCDMVTDGGGWTVVSINGDLNAEGCHFRLRNDAMVCGNANLPDPTTDWQLDGAKQALLTFKEVLLAAYTDSSVFYAATKLVLANPRTIGAGIMTVTPKAISNSPVSCSDGFDLRTRVNVDADGFTLWGEPDNADACSVGSGGTNWSLGLDASSGNGPMHTGWDDFQNGCGCSDSFNPGDIGARRGYYGLR